MPSARTTSVLVVGGLILGISLGVASDPVPETKVVKVPVTEVRTEEKKIYVHTPLPESCHELLEVMETLTENSGEQTKAAGQILLALQDLGKFKVADNLAALTKATQIVRDEKDRLDTASIETINRTLEVEQYLQKCQDDMPDN